MRQACDVAVIGGGPAGSTAASTLASMGWKVTLFEKARHPRFHIGESLLPMNMPVLKELGVFEEVQKIGVYKPGAEFCDPDPRKAPHRFFFRDALDKGYPDAYQVRRDQFDEILLRNAARKGAQVLEEHRVTKLAFAEGQPTVLTVRDAADEVQEWEARYVVDASGRDTVLGNHFRIKRKNMRHGSAAIFGHFRNVPREEGENGGLISISWFPHGWTWTIPLQDGITSVGAVCDPEYLKSRDCSPAEFLQRTLALCPSNVQERMSGAEQVGEVRATGNYSYACDRMVFPGAVLVGDAWAFVDPVFSSGVLLGMRSAQRASKYIDAYLRNDLAQAELLQEEFEKQTRRSVKIFSWMIARFNSPAIRHLFSHPANPFRVQEAVTSMLAGDIDRSNGVLPRLLYFRSIYYLYCFALLPKAIREWRHRSRRAQTEFRGGTTEVDAA